MRTRIIAIGLLSAVVALTVWVIWKHEEPRRNSIHALEHLQNSLSSSKTDRLIAEVVGPSALSQRTIPEQAEFLSKVLQDEISPDGIAALKKGATYGPLRKVFPDDGERWAKQAGVSVDDCVAFRMERNSIRAEVVILSQNGSFRVLRCNNVKQMADTNS